MNDDSRRREDAAVRLEQKFADFLEVYKQDKQSSAEWRIEIEGKMQPLTELHQTLTRPARIIGAVLILMVTPVLGFLGWNVSKWFFLQMEKIVSNHGG